MTAINSPVCGKRKYHDLFGDESHGEWVRMNVRSKGQCGWIPQIKPEREGPFYYDPATRKRYLDYYQAKRGIAERMAPTYPRPRTPEPVECGTVAAYQRHLKNGEVPDAECKAANAARQRQWAHQWRRGRIGITT